MDAPRLAAESPAVPRERWLGLVEGVLKGGDFERRLVGRSYDGLRVEPLYPKAEDPIPIVRAASGPWRIAQRVDHPDPAAANALALADLEGGADTLVLVLAGAPTARGFGLPGDSVAALDRALSGVMLDLVEVRIEAAPFLGASAAQLLAALAERRGLDPGRLTIDFGLDPVGDLARTGRGTGSGNDDLAAEAARTGASLRGQGFLGTSLRVDTRAYHEAGAGEAQELAAALATGVAYLRAMDRGGQDLETARANLSFLLAADADEPFTVAKFRALRRLWARVEEASGLQPRPARVQAETAWRMTTRRDPWVNLLRATIAAFSAGVGGADSITVLPFTTALGLPDGFARRLARNTQHVLVEEANVWRVADPAAGSGAFEALTDRLCERAWDLFQEIEREGGIVASLAAGALQDRIAAVRTERERAAATRKDPITGTSEFPDVRETPVSVLMPLPGAPETSAASPDRETDASAAPGLASEALSAAPLPSTRAAEPFERLRDRADAILAETGRRPRVLLVGLGPPAAFTARATFAKNFFEAGGIEAVATDGFSAHEAAAQAYQSSGVPLCCLCSSDEIYGRHAVATAAALREAGAKHIYLAGRPGPLEEELRSAGVSDFVFAGCNAVALLAQALQRAA